MSTRSISPRGEKKLFKCEVCGQILEEGQLEDKCPKCGASDFTNIRQFNLLFETHMGVTEDTKNKVYYSSGEFHIYVDVDKAEHGKQKLLKELGEKYKILLDEINNTH